MAIHFRDRETAGKLLAYALEQYARNADVIVYALPRGGVILGAEVAKILRAPLRLVITRKIGHPTQPEFAIGAVTETGEPLIARGAATYYDRIWLRDEIAKERREAARRRELYVSGETLSAKDKTIIVVDDGVATGLTLRAALRELRAQGPKKLIVAVPVAPPEVVQDLRHEVDEFIVLDPEKEYLGAVGSYYDDFPQVTDSQVIEAMKSTNESVANRTP